MIRINNILGIKHKQKRINCFVLVLITTYINLLPLLVSAASSAEAYPSDGNLLEGTVVSLSNSDPPKAQLANLNNSQFLIGVIEDNGKSLLTFEKNNASVVVATQGEIAVYVSDLGGRIQPGDFIGASWISGVGMRATALGEQKLLGVALEEFSSENAGAVKVDNIATNEGEKSTYVGKIAVRLFDKELGLDGRAQPSAIEKLAAKLVGKEVSFTRTVAAAGLFIISVIVAGVFLANAIRSSLISIGRNPLSHSPIFNTLSQIAGVSIGLVLIGAAVAFIVLIV